MVVEEYLEEEVLVVDIFLVLVRVLVLRHSYLRHSEVDLDLGLVKGGEEWDQGEEWAWGIHSCSRDDQ